MRTGIAIIIFCLLPTLLLAGTKVIDYGFEDWGDSCPGGNCSGVENAEYTSGYIFGTTSSDRWGDHTTGTEVVESCEECGSRTAYEGTHYWHKNSTRGMLDSCLGSTATDSNSRNNVGLGAEAIYPDKGYGNNYDFANLGDIAVIRYRFRCTGNWGDNQWRLYSDLSECDAGYLKFFRWYGSSAELGGDYGAILVRVYPGDQDVYPGEYTDIYWQINLSDCGTMQTSNNNLLDGEWHSITVYGEILNKTNSDPNVRVRVYWDDWDMEGAPDCQDDLHLTTFGTSWDYFDIAQNFSGAEPYESLLGLDIDDIEVWDGTPDVESSPVSKSGCNPIGCSSTGGG